MLYREIIAVCSEIHAKHINTFSAEHRIFNVKAGGKSSDHWALKSIWYTTMLHKFPGNLRATSQF